MIIKPYCFKFLAITFICKNRTHNFWEQFFIDQIIIAHVAINKLNYVPSAFMSLFLDSLMFSYAFVNVCHESVVENFPNNYSLSL